MSIALLGDVFVTITNWMRGISPWVKGVIISVCVIMCFFLFAKAINVGKNHQDKPIKWLYFVLSFVFMGVAILFAVV